jgi:hypothetical protein
VRDGVSVVACDFPVHVPAVPLQSDARETALDSRESRCTVTHLPASPLDHNAPAGTEIDGLSLAAIVSDVMTAPVTDGHWPTGRGIGPNRKPNALLDRGPIGTESTDPSTRSAVI